MIREPKAPRLELTPTQEVLLSVATVVINSAKERGAGKRELHEVAHMLILELKTKDPSPDAIPWVIATLKTRRATRKMAEAMERANNLLNN